MGNKTMQKYILVLFLLASSAIFAAVDPISSQRLELKPGWNLVTLTRPITSESAERFLALQPMKLDADNKCYVRCTSEDDIKVGVGYWIFSKTAQPPIYLVHDQSQTTWVTATLTQGWNLIGVANNSNWMIQATDIWQWLNDKFQRISKEELTIGEAYWVKQ